MFEKWRVDRRIGYSFKGHVRRVVETKGLGRVGFSLAATAVVAATAFANCNGSDITGPSSDARLEAATDLTSTVPEPQSAGATSTSTVKTGPLKLPFAALPPTNPCTGDAIIWDREKSNLGVTTQTSMDTDGRMHVQFHFNSQAHGTSLTRRYTGSQEYNSQTFTYLPEAGRDNRFKFEWNVKMIAKGEGGGPLGGETSFPEDDFFLHMVAYAGDPPTFVPAGVDVTGEPSTCH